MATTKFSQTRTVEVPYYFVCNYCGKRNDKTAHISAIGEKTVRGAYHGSGEGTPWAAQASYAAEKNLIDEIKRIDNKIKDYGAGLREGRKFRYSFLYSTLKGEHPDHIGFDMLPDPHCSHCGKRQIWSMSPSGKGKAIGCLIILLGFLLMLLPMFIRDENIGNVLFTIGFVSFFGSYVLAWVLKKRSLKKNQAKIAAEPNDPDKLPVLDLESLKAQLDLQS